MILESHRRKVEKLPHSFWAIPSRLGSPVDGGATLIGERSNAYVGCQLSRADLTAEAMGHDKEIGTEEQPD